MVSLRSAIILSQTFDPDAPKQGCKEGGGRGWWRSRESCRSQWGRLNKMGRVNKHKTSPGWNSEEEPERKDFKWFPLVSSRNSPGLGPSMGWGRWELEHHWSTHTQKKKKIIDGVFKMWKRSVSNVVVVVWSYDLQKNATPNHIRVSRADSLRSDDRNWRPRDWWLISNTCENFGW